MSEKSNSTIANLYLAQLKSAEPDASELADVTAQTDPIARSVARRYNRIVRWGAKQMPADLRAEVASLFMKLMIARSERRNANRNIAHLDNFAMNLANRQMALAAMLTKNHEDRKKGGHKKLEKNANARAKRVAKAGALELWIERNNGKHRRLRTVEQFATEVMRRWPILTSAKVICGWSAEWSKQVKGGGNPVC